MTKRGVYIFLGVDKLLKLVNPPAGGKKLVEGLCERELKNPEGCGFDLRLGKVWKIKGEGYLGVEERKTCSVELISEFISGASRGFPSRRGILKTLRENESATPGVLIKPGDFYLVTTIEKVNLPKNLVGIIKPRSTLQRMGIYVRTTQVAPGYCGELTFALKNVGPCNVKVDLGARIVHIMFAEVAGKTALYRGQWKGGRVTVREKERQV